MVPFNPHSHPKRVLWPPHFKAMTIETTGSCPMEGYTATKPGLSPGLASSSHSSRKPSQISQAFLSLSFLPKLGQREPSRERVPLCPPTYLLPWRRHLWHSGRLSPTFTDLLLSTPFNLYLSTGEVRLIHRQGPGQGGGQDHTENWWQIHPGPETTALDAIR